MLWWKKEKRCRGSGRHRRREEKEEEVVAGETRILLGGRTKGGWVLSRFALHASELCAEVARQKGSSSYHLDLHLRAVS